jgi:hypothetical protein
VATPTLKSALNYYLQRPGLSEADRAHLERWLKEVRDPVWEQLAAETRWYGELPPVTDGPYSIFIGSALRARQSTESEKDSPVLQRKRKQQREQQERSDLLELADKMDDVVRHRRSCKKAHHPKRVPSPTGPLPDLPQEAERLSREAHRLRQLAEKQSVGEPNWGWDRNPIHVSRQSGGKGNASGRASWVCSCSRWSTACTDAVGSRTTMPSRQ